jgi:hypothetical protein
MKRIELLTTQAIVKIYNLRDEKWNNKIGNNFLQML